MPPLEAFKTAVSLMTSRQTSSGGKQLKVTFFDISQARFYGKVDREVCAELPEELKIKHGRDVAAKLKKSWHGAQDARHIWQGDCTDLLEEHGRLRGKSNGALLYKPELDVRTLRHGDDFLHAWRRRCDQGARADAGQEVFAHAIGDLGP
jgi:hypothetical protein